MLETGPVKGMEMGSDNRTQLTVTDNLTSRLTIIAEIGINIEIIRGKRTRGTIKVLDMAMETKTDGIISMKGETKEITQDKTRITPDGPGQTTMELHIRTRGGIQAKADGTAKAPIINGIRMEFQIRIKGHKITSDSKLVRIPDTVETTKSDPK